MKNKLIHTILRLDQRGQLDEFDSVEEIKNKYKGDTMICPTCGSEIFSDPNKDYGQDGGFCSVCVIELKRKIDAGEIDLKELGIEE